MTGNASIIAGDGTARAAQNPLVSVGIPVYNGEQYLRKAFDSLLSQTYRNIELVISDNASTDRTAEICKDYADKDHRIRYYRNDTNVGIIKNFYRAFELSSGEFFMWNSVDDVRPTSTIVQNCVEALLKNKDAVLAHGPVIVKTKGYDQLMEISNELGPLITSRKPGERIRAFTKGLKHNAIEYGLYRRSALAKGVYGEHFGTEYLFCLQMCLLGTLQYVREPMITYEEKFLTRHDSPMSVDKTVSFTELLISNPKRRRKCWTVLVLGCYYLWRLRNVSAASRLSGIFAHLSAFIVRHRSLLVQETLYSLILPVGSMTLLSWRLIRKFRTH